MIKSYLSDIINDQKTPKNLTVYSGNKVIDCETQSGELVNNANQSYFF